MPERWRQRMAAFVRESGSVTVAGLEEFGISPATARWDLAALERVRDL